MGCKIKKAVVVTIEDNIVLVRPTKTGYTFTGWTGSNGTTPTLTITISKSEILFFLFKNNEQIFKSKKVTNKK